MGVEEHVALGHETVQRQHTSEIHCTVRAFVLQAFSYMFMMENSLMMAKYLHTKNTLHLAREFIVIIA